ncbi:hypothetical protein CJF32_00001017 [Rutstroemia sp. NJR-2017a WRK4]|nr:hypothetical protein CJF32_00001017 [Rutstroemia sp. NJR-2017a WRK4]
MNLFLGIAWSLVTLTVATKPLVNRHQLDANHGDTAVHHEVRQLEAGGVVLPGSSLVTQNNVVVATLSVTGKFSNTTAVAAVASSTSPSFVSITPTSFLDPAPLPKKTISTLVTVETVSLPQETSTETDVFLTTSSAATSTTGSFKDVVGDTVGNPNTPKETALPESSSAPVETITTVTLIPIEVSSSSDSSTAPAPSSPVAQAPVSSTALPFASDSAASFTSTHVVGTPISNSQQSSAKSPLTTTTTTTSTTTRFTTTTVTDGTVTSTVTLPDVSAAQSLIFSITSQSIIGKLPSSGSPPDEATIETFTSGGSTYTTTETAPGSTMTLSIAINPSFDTSASYLPQLPGNTAAGLTASLTALPSCTCPTPQIVTPSFVPAVHSSSSITTISIYPSPSSVVVSLSKATPYSNGTIPVSTSGSLLGTAIQPPLSSSPTHSDGQLPSGNRLSVTPVPQSTSPFTSTGAADRRRMSIGAEGVALVVGFMALVLLF